MANGTSTLFENKQATAIAINATSVNYSNNAFPNTGIDVFTINYFDDYNSIDLDGGSAVVSYGITPITNAKGLNTCSKVRILGTSNWTTNVIYYDAKGRPVYNYSKNNYLSVTATVKTKLDFAGKVLETTSTSQKGTDALITLVDVYSYDHTGRLLTQKQTINNQEQEVIASNTYDNLGQLATKGVGGKITQLRLQNIDYSYNIRGWLKNINDVNTIGSDLFAFQINYNTPTSGTSLFNGNISQTFWKTANIDSNLKNYTYAYDDLNRLTQGTDNSASSPGRYNEGLTYDKNGNIMDILRLGNTNPAATTFGTMDNLAYTYDGGNKLTKVEDTSGSTEGFSNGSNIATEYTYDLNGNMKTDANKGISAITYNHLNLPTSVSIGGGTINYVYDATGVKQSKTISTGGSTVYAGSFVYENNSLKQFSQPEGYVTYSAGIFNYIYQYKDHLGNNRLSYQDKDNNGVVNSTEIVQENNYYAFGLIQKGYNGAINGVDNKYKYNGKELQDDNIAGTQLNFYDFGARNYDPALGRWMNIDPLAETSRRFSPYTYALNNPIYFIDPDGMEATNSYVHNSQNVNGRHQMWSDRHSGDFSNMSDNSIGDNIDNEAEITGNESIGNDQQEIDPKKKKPRCQHTEIDTSDEAKEHYEDDSNGRAIRLSRRSMRALMQNPAFQRVQNLLRTGKAKSITNDFDVDMTGDTFHIGDTNVKYETSCQDGTCTTKYTMFIDDGFWDPNVMLEYLPNWIGGETPDGKGPNLETDEGTPYSYIPAIFIDTYRDRFPKKK